MTFLEENSLLTRWNIGHVKKYFNKLEAKRGRKKTVNSSTINLRIFFPSIQINFLRIASKTKRNIRNLCGVKMCLDHFTLDKQNFAKKK